MHCRKKKKKQKANPHKSLKCQNVLGITHALFPHTATLPGHEAASIMHSQNATWTLPVDDTLQLLLQNNIYITQIRRVLLLQYVYKFVLHPYIKI